MKKERTLAYKVATTISSSELTKISGGISSKGTIFIPTLQITGRPFISDVNTDNDKVPI